jgi:hypothetical protein
MIKKKKYDYYKLDVGFYPDVMKLCFDDAVFQQILKDHNITLKASALDTGVAETHQIGDGKSGIIILAFNLKEMGDTLAECIDTIAHEVSHAVDHLAEFIGEEDGIRGETRAYITGSLVKQVYKIYEHEKEKHARKASGKVPSQKGKRSGRADVQVDQHSVGGPGQDSISKREVLPSGTENGNWSPIAKADPRL